MLLPTRIEVRNIRSIEHAVVEPLADGITAFAGRAGAGKSTLVNAMLWTLYGEVGGIPGLLVQSEMRRADSLSDEPAEAVVDFTLNGDTYRAARRLRRRSRGGQDVEIASADLWINDVKQPQITPSKLTEKITSLTGLTGRAYSGAFFCAQFHLPALAEGTPAEVQRIIEDQTGLTALTKKIDKARSAANDAQVVADALPGSLEEVEEAKKELDTAQSDGARLWSAFEVAQQRATKTHAAWEAARNEHSALASRHRAAQQAAVKIADITARIESVTEQITELNREADGLPQVDVEAIRARGTALRTAIDTAQRTQHLVGTAETALADARAARQRADETVAALPADVSTASAAAAARVAQLHNDMGALHGEYQRLGRAIDTIRESGPDTADCPTCAQRLTDARQLLIDLIGHRDQIAAKGTAARQELATAEAEATRLAGQGKAREAAVTEQQRATAAEETAHARHQAAQAHAQTAAEDLRAAINSTPGTPIETLIETAQQELDKAAAAMAAADRATTIRTQIEARTATRVDLERGLSDAQTAAADTVSDDALLAAETRATDTHAAHAVEDAARQSAETTAKVAAERARAAEAAYDRTNATLDAKVEALTKADTLRHATQMLAALRKDLLADYTATISDAATHLMQQVGGGDHAGVVLDETFVPRVILTTGDERPMRVLSGGEKMRAALCLRLGIADQIVGGSGTGMIVADEITANQDEGTTQEIVDLIRRLGRPMVLIAHAPQVTQIANRVYEFDKPDEAAGTTVTLAGAPVLAPTP